MICFNMDGQDEKDETIPFIFILLILFIHVNNLIEKNQEKCAWDSRRILC